MVMTMLYMAPQRFANSIIALALADVSLIDMQTDFLSKVLLVTYEELEIALLGMTDDNDTLSTDSSSVQPTHPVRSILFGWTTRCKKLTFPIAS
jgi:hypothetical protein